MSKEDLEANAFAGLLLMPDSMLEEHLKLYGINSEKISVDDVLTLMDLFGLPYKAVVLRLVENHNISPAKAIELLTVDIKLLSDRIMLTGKALAWQQNSKDLSYFGGLLDDMNYNSEHELLTDSREESDKKYPSSVEVLCSFRHV